MNIQERIEQHYKDNQKALCLKIQKRVFDPQDIEDIVQEAFTKALKFSSAFKEEGNFNAWFGIILDNCVKDYRAEFLYNKIGMGHRDVEELDEDNFPIDCRELDLDWITVKKIMEDIGVKAPSQQEVLRLYYFFDYKPEEIKFLTQDYSLSSIKSLVKRFKQEVISKYG